MSFRALALALLLVSAAVPQAEARVTLGYGRMFDNDAIGDGKDRWRTASYALSIVRGDSFAGVLPDQLGEIVEWRISAAIFAPQDLANPAASDRRNAGQLSLGLHSQVKWLGFDVDFGAEMVSIGPANGVAELQNKYHDLVGEELVDLADQLPNRIYPTASAEIGREVPVGALRLRPFLAAQAGVEDLVRAGLDVTLGSFGRGAIMMRDEGTGQRYRGAVSDIYRGFSLVAGGDVAHVYGSALFPEDGPAPEDTRTRARLGLHWQGERASAFYGVTWLSKEFEGQGGGQAVGSLSFNMRF